MGIWNRRERDESAARLEALDRFQAIVEFAMDGTVITANQNFLDSSGYRLDEIRGKPHSMFVDPEYAASNTYREFWDKLRQGERRTGRFKRIGRNGREIWVQASCNPIMDKHNKPLKVVTYAIDITELVDSRMEIAGLIKESSENIKNVSSAAEGMSASINEINRNMTLSKTAVGDIVSKINFAEEASKQLLKTSKSMEGIVEFIRGIAEQVNLLALNATIEAARAGEAGKGFAVVASEVKSLANQTGAATDNISKEIAAMQDISTKVASSVAEAVKTADLVSEYVSSVAAALEEQSIVTRDISGNTHKSLDLIGGIRNCLLKG